SGSLYGSIETPMLPEDSPFPFTDELPELPFALNGSFDWLGNLPSFDSHIGRRKAGELTAQLSAAKTSAEQQGFALPQEFASFVLNPELHQHLRSSTDCYLSLTESVLQVLGGSLLRFLADSQGAVYWYLFLNSDGSDHCVVSSFEYFDADQMDYEPEEIQESDFRFEAESFEAFLCRFWLVNEISFAEDEGDPLPNVEPRFLELYNPY
ncbi:MAG: hypothetical protein KDA84_30140, partial [Planctomycetaceae bacterium]|nr:hypothetical protein [Planctomycetaceae bacterium]